VDVFIDDFNGDCLIVVSLNISIDIVICWAVEVVRNVNGMSVMRRSVLVFMKTTTVRRAVLE